MKRAAEGLPQIPFAPQSEPPAALASVWARGELGRRGRRRRFKRARRLCALLGVMLVVSGSGTLAHRALAEQSSAGPHYSRSWPLSPISMPAVAFDQIRQAGQKPLLASKPATTSTGEDAGVTSEEQARRLMAPITEGRLAPRVDLADIVVAGVGGDELASAYGRDANTIAAESSGRAPAPHGLASTHDKGGADSGKGASLRDATWSDDNFATPSLGGFNDDPAQITAGKPAQLLPLGEAPAPQPTSHNSQLAQMGLPGEAPVVSTPPQEQPQGGSTSGTTDGSPPNSSPSTTGETPSNPQTFTQRSSVPPAGSTTTPYSGSPVDLSSGTPGGGSEPGSVPPQSESSQPPGADHGSDNNSGRSPDESSTPGGAATGTLSSLPPVTGAHGHPTDQHGGPGGHQQVPPGKGSNERASGSRRHSSPGERQQGSTTPGQAVRRRVGSGNGTGLTDAIKRAVGRQIARPGVASGKDEGAVSSPPPGQDGSAKGDSNEYSPGDHINPGGNPGGPPRTGPISSSGPDRGSAGPNGGSDASGGGRSGKNSSPHSGTGSRPGSEKPANPVPIGPDARGSSGSGSASAKGTENENSGGAGTSGKNVSQRTGGLPAHHGNAREQTNLTKEQAGSSKAAIIRSGSGNRKPIASVSGGEVHSLGDADSGAEQHPSAPSQQSTPATGGVTDAAKVARDTTQHSRRGSQPASNTSGDTAGSIKRNTVERSNTKEAGNSAKATSPQGAALHSSQQPAAALCSLPASSRTPAIRGALTGVVCRLRAQGDR